jgi:hypothetical protein
MEIRELSSTDLRIIQRFGVVLIQFYDGKSEEADLIKKEIEKIHNENMYYSALRFDINQNPDLANEFNVTSPTLIILKGEEILGREANLKTADEISD